MRSAGRVIHHSYHLLHRVLLVATGLLALSSCLLAVTAWRLAQGPIDLGWLADRAKAALIDDAAPVHVSFDRLALAWEGFQKGADHPLDLQLLNVVITDAAGHRLLAAPDAHVTFSIAGLLLGRIVPRAIEVDHGEFAVSRNAAGEVDIGLDLGTADATDPDAVDLRQLRQQLALPASTDHGRSRAVLDQLQRVHLRNTAVSFRDRPSGLVVRTSGMDIDLVRSANGQIRGSLQAPLALGDAHASLTVATEPASGGDSRFELRLTPFRPSAVGPLPPRLAGLSGVDLPVSAVATVVVDAAFRLAHMELSATLGEGRVRIGQTAIALRSGTIDLAGTTDKLSISQGRLDFAHSAAGAPEIVNLTGSVSRVSDRVTASLTVGVEGIDIADLARLWPAEIGSGARSWVTEHVTGGMLTHGSASLVVEADATLRDVVLTKATGDLDGSNGVFTWLDNMPAVEQAEVHLHLVDPDTLDIRVSSGRQKIGSHGADLLLKDGQIRISGLALPDQTAVIRTQLDGQLASALALLSEPRLNLLSTHPIGLKLGAGEASAALEFKFPLQTNLRIDDLQIHANAHLRRVRVPDVAAGQELADGTFDLDVDKDGLRLNGRGLFALVPVTLDGMMDFTPGNADQVVQRIAISGQPSAAQLDAAGLPLKPVASGPIPTTAVVVERRNGEASVLLNGDLTQAELAVGPLAWSKPAGATASATATLMTSHGRLTRIEHIAIRGDGLLLSGLANCIDGHLRSVRLDDIRLGRSGGRGVVTFASNNEIGIVLQGSQLDLSPKLAEKTSAVDSSAGQSGTTPLWTLDARFEHVILANGESANGVLMKANGAGEAIRLLDIVGAMEPGAGFAVKVDPGAGKRRLLVDAKDAGRFLRGIDAIRVLQSGHLTVNAVLDSPGGFHPLAGTAVLDDVVVQNLPVLGKLLQAITLYGLVDVLRGPGMTFSTVAVPFHYDGANLTLDDAHANNASLGMTAKGRIGLSSGRVAITGTIVPAYFFNALPGQLPLVGKLFSPEKGGGVFAARFSLDGAIADPAISINPASALTPGFLREIFSIFDKDR